MSYAVINSQSKKICVLYCPDLTYAFDKNQTCISNCPLPLYADNSSNRCLKNCLFTFYGDNTTGYGVCVKICNFGFADNVTNTCVGKCPDGTYG
jgi:hypothetical protein